MSARASLLGGSERLRAGKGKGWGLEVEGAETQGGLLGASGPLTRLGETKKQEFSLGKKFKARAWKDSKQIV